MKLKWDSWRGPIDGGEGQATMHIKRLLHWKGLRLDLHKMTGADMSECFHTHPSSKAIRLILWGGYVEEVMSWSDRELVEWKPFNLGLVRYDLCHRIHRLIKGPSYSLWLRWPCDHNVNLVGSGWTSEVIQAQKERNQHAADRRKQVY